MDTTTAILRASELGVLGLFGVVLWRAWHQRETQESVAKAQSSGNSQAIGTTRRREFVWLLSAFLFAFAFEDLNVLTVTRRGSYFYNPRFGWWLDQVPVFIVAAWAVILWSANALAQAATNSVAARVAQVGMLAVLLDIGFDAVAIRYGMWTWRDVTFEEAWFGVPAGNFFGWLWVSLAFALLTQVLARLAALSALLRRFWTVCQLVLVPLLALGLYKAVELTTSQVLLTLRLASDQASLLAFWMVFLLVILIAHTGHRVASRPPTLSWVVRACFGAFSLFGLLLLPANSLLQQQRPLLLLITALLIALELWSYWRVVHPFKDNGLIS